MWKGGEHDKILKKLKLKQQWDTTFQPPDWQDFEKLLLSSYHGYKKLHFIYEY